MYKIRHYSNLRPNTHARTQTSKDKTRQEHDETTRQQALTRNKKKHTNTPGTCVFLSSMSTNSVRCYEIPPAPGKMSHFLFFFFFLCNPRAVCPSPSVALVKGRFTRCFLVAFYAWIFWRPEHWLYWQRDKVTAIYCGISIGEWMNGYLTTCLWYNLKWYLQCFTICF